MNRQAQHHLVTGIFCLLPAFVFPFLDVLENNLANGIVAGSFVVCAAISFYQYYKISNKGQ